MDLNDTWEGWLCGIPSWDVAHSDGLPQPPPSELAGVGPGQRHTALGHHQATTVRVVGDQAVDPRSIRWCMTAGSSTVHGTTLRPAARAWRIMAAST